MNRVIRGKDVGQYQVNWAGMWLIDTHNGYGDIPRVDVEKFKAVKRHLDQYYRRLDLRQDQGDTPYNLRSCGYHEEFRKEKIMWKRIG